MEEDHVTTKTPRCFVEQPAFPTAFDNNVQAMRSLFFFVVTLILLKLFFPQVGSLVSQIVDTLLNLLSLAISHLPDSLTST